MLPNPYVLRQHLAGFRDLRRRTFANPDDPSRVRKAHHDDARGGEALSEPFQQFHRAAAAEGGGRLVDAGVVADEEEAAELPAPRGVGEQQGVGLWPVDTGR
ncbi:hypothetical protein J7E99_35825 [Streptomyces sp. ISL-44]|uniref:hypothetical protein n=1 Tax=Streptomyces sp. ISL-44 TaxID=2819184 RepID=UPI001BE938D1|nr:hypothetical protein [Streptomyces sp. ISL-44]MBT2545892.1 hypothetical protein [Streptomyces sp. ISL-44]